MNKVNNQKINQLIAEKIMGWVEHSEFNFTVWKDSEDMWHGFTSDFKPSENMNDAWLIVQKLKLTIHPTYNGWEVFRSNTSRSERDCQYIGTTNNQKWVEHESAPMAICLFGLQTVGITI